MCLAASGNQAAVRSTPGAIGLSAGDVFHTRPTLTHADLYNLQPGLHGLADPIPAVFPGFDTEPVLARRDPYVRW